MFGQTWEKLFLLYVLWLMKMEIIPMPWATSVSACSLTRSKQLCAYISYSVRTTIAMRDGCSKETVSRSNILRRWLWQQDKPRLDNRNALWDFTRVTLYGLFRKNAAPRIESRTQTQTLCEPAQSKCKSSHFTRATLYRNLQEKYRGPAGAPWSSTGLYSYCKNPSVWTHCLVNYSRNYRLILMDLAHSSFHPSFLRRLWNIPSVLIELINL